MSAAEPAAAPRGRLLAWIDRRLPVRAFIESQMTRYYAPRNLNVWYYFGALALVVLVLQLVTGIFLAMYYKPASDLAFDSVEYVMREVNWGWLIRYAHATGASAFFVVVYLHMYRALLYGSYKAPRELLWVLGMLLFFVLMAEAFMGYVLPWGNMSYWGAQVIVNLAGAIPGIGPAMVEWVRGDYGISDATLNRFFALHVVAAPLALLLLVGLHLVALHRVGSGNPDGIEIGDNVDATGKPLDGVPFHPYYTVKDSFIVGVFLVVFAVVLFFVPTLGGLALEAANFQPADALSTPEHIAPVWYFTPFYAVLRAIPDQGLGALAMALAVLSFVFLPWLDRSPVRSMRYKGWYSRVALVLFVVSFVGLGYLGLMPAREGYLLATRILTGIYFGYFWLMPLYTKLDSTKPAPVRVR